MALLQQARVLRDEILLAVLELKASVLELERSSTEQTFLRTRSCHRPPQRWHRTAPQFRQKPHLLWVVLARFHPTSP